MKLTRPEIKRILAHDVQPIVREDEPACEVGQVIPVSWSRPGRYVRKDKAGQPVRNEEGEPIVIAPDPQCLVEIIVSAVTRRKKGGWSVRFGINDRRQSTRLLRAGAPSSGHKRQAGLKTRLEKPKPKGTDTPSWTPETERGYGGSVQTAADENQSPDDADLKQFATEARERFARRQAEGDADEQRRQQERAIRDRLRETLDGLNPTAATLLLASIEREIRAARETKLAA